MNEKYWCHLGQCLCGRYGQLRDAGFVFCHQNGGVIRIPDCFNGCPTPDNIDLNIPSCPVSRLAPAVDSDIDEILKLIEGGV